MKRLTIPYVNPRTKTALSFIADSFQDPTTGEVFPVVGGIPRFCKVDNYAESFGFQWSKFSRTQLDPTCETGLSERRFYASTGWSPTELAHCALLEVGSGAGRFSEVILRTSPKAVLYSVDYSSAVDTNLSNNSVYRDRLQIAQASIYELPFPDNSFDKVVCLGVLQHTPSFADSVAALIMKTRVGGEIVVDFYPIKGWYTKLHSKYILRPITRKMPKSLLLRIISYITPRMLKLFDFFCRHRLGLLTRFIPITDVRNFPIGLDSQQRLEWAIMDTFDGLSPKYDSPQRLQDVIQMFTSRNCRIDYAGIVTYEGGASMVVQAYKLVDREVI